MTDEQRRRELIDSIGGLDPVTVTPAKLREMAAGPLHDPLRIFLPAGRLSVAETAARETRIRAGMSS